MDRKLSGLLLTAFAFCLTISCSDKSATGPTGLALNDSTVTAARVASATVTLAQSTLEVGQTTQATALLLDRYGNTLTLAVVWSTSDSSLATVSASGLVTARAVGAVSIIATRGYHSGAATLTVVPSTGPPVASISVALPANALSIGQTTQAVDTTRDSTNNVLMGRTVVWTTSDANVATISGTGLVTALAAGAATITASSEGKTGTAPLAVAAATPVPVASVSVSPATSTLPIGGTVQLQVSAFDANNNPLTGRTVTSSSADPGIASVNSLGLVTAVSAGTTQITVTVEGKSAVATIIVSATATKPGAVTDLQVSAIGSTGVTLSFTQVDDGTGQPAKYDVRYAVAPIQWGAATSTTTGTCTTPVAGTATGTQLSCTVLGLTPATNYNFQLVAFRGTMNLNAVYGPLSNIVAATTTATAPAPPVPVASVSVSPASSNLLIGATVQLQVTAFDANGNVLTGRVVTSSSANPAIASVNSLGLVTAVSAGTTQITVTSEGKSAIATIIVTAPPPPPIPVASVSVSPGSSSLLVGATAQLTATTRDANNNVLTGRVVTWSSSNTSISTVSASGLATAVAAGSATITATSETKTGNAAIAVSAPAPAPVASVTVSPANPGVQVGGTVQLSAVTRDANNNVLTGRVISWSSSNTGIGSVSATGLVTGLSAGSATITATSETQSGSASLTVTAPPPPPPPGSVEPSGMTRITERPFSAMVEDNWYFEYNQTNAMVVQDATAPYSPSGVMQLTYPAGMPGGVGPNSLERDWSENTYRTLYVSYWMKLSTNFYGHIGPEITKTLHFWVGDGSTSGNKLYTQIAGGGTDPLSSWVNLQGVIAGGNFDSGTSAEFAPNLGSPASVIRGQWQHYEVVMKGNSAGAQDGTVDWWLDGVHVGSYSGIQYVPGAAHFFAVKWNPTWGGLGYTVPYDFTESMDHIYISGKP